MAMKTLFGGQVTLAELRNPQDAELDAALSRVRSQVVDASRMLVTQGHGDPHWISVGGSIEVPLHLYQDALRDASRNSYNCSVPALAGFPLTSVGRGNKWWVLLHVFGAHAQFDSRLDGDDIFTTRPYQCVTLRASVLVARDTWSEMMDLRADILLPEVG